MIIEQFIDFCKTKNIHVPEECVGEFYASLHGQQAREWTKDEIKLIETAAKKELSQYKDRISGMTYEVAKDFTRWLWFCGWELRTFKTNLGTKVLGIEREVEIYVEENYPQAAASLTEEELSDPDLIKILEVCRSLDYEPNEWEKRIFVRTDIPLKSILYALAWYKATSPPLNEWTAKKILAVAAETMNAKNIF